MSFRAMHKPTGKIIEARKLESDPIWKTKTKDDWIFIPGLIPLEIQRQMSKKGITELKVSFVKSHPKEKVWFRAHFRRENLENINLENLENESDEHKLCKEGVYFEILDDKLLIDFGEKETKKINELCSDYDCHMEERISSERNAKIGDIVLTFDKEHSILGKGIVFEVQFSNQSFDKTIVRTNDRVQRGYSVSWLWSGQFDEENELLNKTIKVIPFREALKKFDENFEKSVINNYEEIQKDIETKLSALDIMKERMYSEITKSINIIGEEVEKRTEGFYGQFDNIVEGALSKFNPKLLKSVQEKADLALEGLDIEKEIMSIINSKVIYSLNRIERNFKNEHIIPKLNSLDNEIDSIINATKKRYDSLLSAKINSLIEERKEDFFVDAFNKAIENVPEEIANKFKEKLDLYKCENCGAEVPFTDIHWRGTVKHIALCKKCWIELDNPLNEKRGGQ